MNAKRKTATPSTAGKRTAKGFTDEEKAAIGELVRKVAS